jgi:Mg-chelatase subunit ChlD
VSDEDGANNGRQSRVTFFGSTIGMILLQAAIAPLQSVQAWFLFVVGAVVTGLAATGLLLPALKWLINNEPVRKLIDRVSERLLWKLPRRILLRTIPVGLALILAIALGRSALDQLKVTFVGCDEPPVELTALSSPNGLDPALKLAASYERSTAASNNGCPTANVYVYAVPEEIARQALSNGWRLDPVEGSEPLRDVGPRPDVWLPDSSLEVNRLDSTVRNTEIAANEYIASSPLVIGITASALPPEMQSQGNSWAALFDQTTVLDRGVVRPDPSTSLVGIISTAVLYGKDLDGSGRWKAENPVLDPRAIEQRIGRSLDRDQYPLGDETDLLCRHRQLADPRAALIISQQQLIRFNEGQPLGGGCGSTQFTNQRNQLVPLFPASTPSLDHRIVRFKWSEPKQAEKATGFASWLSSEEGRHMLADVALRPAGPPFAGVGAIGGNGGSEGGPVYIASDTAVINSTLEEYNVAQRRGRVLVALDVSGSMRAFVGQDGQNRFDLVSQSIQAVLPSMSDRDEIGLSLFPGDATGLTARQAVPIGARDEPLGPVTRGQAIIDELRRSTPSGNTPLFRAIVDGVAAVGPSDVNRISGLVVLTDGKDTTSGLAPGQVSAAVQGREVRVFVVSVGEASCAIAPLPEVTTTTGGGCYDADFESVDERLAQVLAVFFGGS